MEDPIMLLLVIVGIFILCKIIKAGIKLTLGIIALAVLVWFATTYLPELTASVPFVQQEVFSCMTV